MAMPTIKHFRWEFLSFISGTVLTLAFSPFDFYLVAYFSLMLLYASWLDVSPGKAALRGYLFGMGLFASGVSWVFVSVHDYGGASLFSSVLLTAIVVLFWSVFPAITGYLSVRLLPRHRRNDVIWLIPFVWILIEYFRGYWFLNGFPWFQIGYTQSFSVFQGLVPVLGVYGSGFVLACSISLLLAVYRKRLTPGLALGLCISVVITSQVLERIEWTTPAGAAIKVALIQGNVAQDQKWQPQNRINTLKSYQQLTLQQNSADLIIWPETAIPASLSQVKTSYLEPLSEKARKMDATVLVSLPDVDAESRYYNTVLSIGNNQGRYDKNHLLPFGEYLPFQPVSGWILESMNIRLGDFTSGGNDQALLSVLGYPFAVSICYEDAFADLAVAVMPEARFLVNVTNDAWFGNSLEPHQHMQIAKARALETGRYLLRSTNTGVTAIVSPKGETLKSAVMFEQTVLKGEIIPMQGMTPFSRIGDHGMLLIISVLGGLFFLCRIRCWRSA